MPVFGLVKSAVPDPAAPRRDVAVKGLPLAFWLPLLVALVLVALIAVASWLSWQNGQRAVGDLVGQLQSRAGKQVEEHLRGYLESPRIAVEIIADAFQKGEITPERPATIHALLLRLARAYEGISYLNIGLEDGRFFGLGRSSNVSPELVIEETGPPDLAVLHQYGIAEDGTRAALRRELPFSDIREQAWYSEPLAAGRTSWTSIYNWVDNPDVVVIGLGTPVRFGTAGTRGVVGIDLFLANICDYLAALDVSPGARVFIFERDGTLVANSHGNSRQRGAGSPAQLRPVSQAVDPLVRRAARHIQEDGGFAGIREPRLAKFRADGAGYFLRVSPWRDSLGLDWLIAVVVPEADFTATITANLRMTLAAGAGLLVLALALALLMARYISRPLHRMEAAAKAVAAGDFDMLLPTTAYREFNRLSLAFDDMTRRLRAAFREVEAAQNELEQKVAQRTEELREANEELERLSRQDSLTGLANRRRFDPDLREEWLRARRSGEPLTLVMCDLDYFKAYNDRYGHTRGDEVLVKVARVLQSELRRSSDLAARYGGEEYALILPNTSAADAQAVLAQIRAGMAALGLVHEASPFGRITMSFGIACHQPGSEFASAEDLLVAADQALYRAKAAGRDRVAVHGKLREIVA
ncbi:MAG: diguanylate cyclase [Pseudomonadales bacterium]|nr:diguanylate cyclase [Pseudomonadales bacterium]